MERTQWIAGGITILEPMTAITDFIVTAVCVAAFIKLRRISKQSGGYLSIYPYFFLTMGLGCMMAGIMTHALAYAFVPELLDKSQIAQLDWSGQMAYHLHDLPNWLLNIMSVTLFEFSIIARASDATSKSRTGFKVLAAVESAIAAAATIWLLTYDIATAHIGVALYAIGLPLEISMYRSGHSREAIYLMAGSALMLVIAPVMAMKIQFSPWFNHNDISHCVIAATMLIFCKSAQTGLSQGKI